jgi:hypothetical protein
MDVLAPLSSLFSPRRRSESNFEGGASEEAHPGAQTLRSEVLAIEIVESSSE